MHKYISTGRRDFAHCCDGISDDGILLVMQLIHNEKNVEVLVCRHKKSNVQLKCITFDL